MANLAKCRRHARDLDTQPLRCFCCWLVFVVIIVVDIIVVVTVVVIIIDVIDCEFELRWMSNAADLNVSP